ncbi:hypothetical protein [Streptomyces naphthomycinicus]|uniref:hypothetical protein n=1 Tax=Streptomyces naphthomycinicus TaxID=2872625 RepID=UPI001CEDEBD5|nr:hypothetical protein [Streptomyces sp. TML10]
MPLFRRAKKAAVPAGSPVPPWCSGFTPADWQAFQDLLNDVFLDGNTSGPPMRFGAERHLRLGAENEPGIPLDLAEIAAIVRPLDRKDWRAATVAHLTRQLEIRDRREALHRAGLEEVRHLVLPRVVPADTVGEEHALTTPLTTELSAVVVLRIDAGLSAAVPPGQFRSWGVTENEVWAAALDNLRGEPVRLDTDGKANPMMCVEGEAGFTCTHLLRAAEILGRPAPLGILAMIPHEESFYLQAVHGPDLHSQLVGYSSVVRDNWEKAPAEQRLSPKVLWIHEGEIEAVGVEPAPPGSDRPGVIRGSERFLGILASFRPPDPEPGP